MASVPVLSLFFLTSDGEDFLFSSYVRLTFVTRFSIDI